ncbi:DUF2813 domain-containing protein [Conservatibacter flavescens]|uniref:ATP-dependent endonuclease n=1 Tax=Conservatibacter flavescens TaxID=28161 RepID=A0A2M8S5H5_9PAST|nr:DUF2813 domain-containing protein [Conservatibacter flavescens]PJG86387.1 ATP-dependent endonuclease [Conservatibacter flavescens]
MYLRQIEVVGFRGINRLSLNLRADMVLIGENAWGKSSLLDALCLILNPTQSLYQFNSDDFHLCYAEDVGLCRHITLLFTFSEQASYETGNHAKGFYRDVLSPHEDGFQRIYLRVTGDLLNDQQVKTEYSFLDAQGLPIDGIDVEKLVLQLMAHYPVYRFRDARLKSRYHHTQSGSKIDKIGEFGEEIHAVSLLLQYYFIRHDDYPQLLNQVKDTTQLWQKVQSLCQRLRQDSTSRLQKQLFLSLSSLFANSYQHTVKQHVKPIILFEDPESRLHPRMLAIAWELANYLPIQRITTTNSVELLSQVDLRSICRLVRYSDRTHAFQLDKHLGKEELRRLNFHIHYNRSLALFSRTWILVEGETEVWMLSELAKLLEINLEMEGIRIVEFAQSGLRPLIKYVQAMGIEWYVLTDGDKAGLQYTELVKSMLGENENLSSRITTLPKRDIEHFFYVEGFESVFIRLAHWVVQKNQYLPASRIIQKAIQRTSKPDLAIALSKEMRKRGKQSIPSLFKRLFSKVLILAKGM